VGGRDAEECGTDEQGPKQYTGLHVWFSSLRCGQTGSGAELQM
jgi:hypothetical protein